jgi:transcriptional regulator with GAF, ATPase, and Fis domain
MTAMAERIETSPGGFSRVLIDDRSLDAIMDLIVTLARRSLASVDAATISLLRTAPDRLDSIIDGSDMDIRAIDQIQYDTGEGPSMTALHTGRFVRTLVDAEPDRWPAFASMATATGISQAISFPLVVRGQPIGALNLYCRANLAVGHDQIASAQALADKASIVLANFTSHGTAELARAQLEETLRSRDIVGQARTILTLTKDCTPQEAFAILRRAAQERNTTLRQIADKFVKSSRRDRKRIANSAGPAETTGIETTPADRLESARRLVSMSTADLWWKYLALGGDGDRATVETILDGSLPVDHYSYDIISQALNERFLELGMNPPLPPADHLDWS